MDRAAESRRAIEAVWRVESARVIAVLARQTGDLSSAEDLAQEAVVAALRKWPETGIPANPAGWLVTVGKRRHLDSLRRGANFDSRRAERAREALDRGSAADVGGALSDAEIEDDLLRLIFISCHRVLSDEARVALTLRLVGGLSTEEIAHAFLVPEATVAQRIVRAKRTLAEAGVRFELPAAGERLERLSSVLEVVYLVFNEGYVATKGADWARPALCREGLRLGRVLAALLPEEGEVHGPVSLMELQASRLHARIGPGGEPVLLGDQDRTRWDRLLISRGLAALRRAAALGPLGPYGLQAAIASQHAAARSMEETDWAAIVALYEALAQVQPSPVVELNRAVAVSRAYKAEAGLEILEPLSDDATLRRSHLLASVRGDLLRALGRNEEAREAFELAASLTGNEGERAILLARAAKLSDEVPQVGER